MKVHILKDEIFKLKLLNYLKNPTENGIWVLKYKYIRESQILKEINLILDTKKQNPDLSLDEKINIQKAIDLFSLGNLVFISEELFTKEKKNITGSLFNLSQFIFDLLNFVTIMIKEVKDDSDNHLKEEELEDFLYETKYSPSLSILDIHSLLDLNKPQNFFEESLNYYIKHFYEKSNFVKNISESGLYINPELNFIIYDFNLNPDFNFKSNYIFSLEKESLEKISHLLGLLGVISDVNISKYHSSENTDLSPYNSYFDYLNVYLEFISENKEYKAQIFRAISQYYIENDNYILCINTIGKLSEQILTEIYETLFREEPDKNAIGELYWSINDKTRKIINPNNQNKDYEDELKKEISGHFGDIKKVTDMEEIKSILLKINSTIQKQQKIIEYKKNNSNSNNSESVFPKYLQKNIEELRNNRNAISHSSRRKFDYSAYEAKRTVYDCITLLFWWNETYKTIDWKKGRDEIIIDLVEKAKENN